MGVINNECVIATTWNNEAVSELEEWIMTLENDKQLLFVSVQSLVEKRTTIILGPDGSKKGWPEEKIGETLREAFINKLNSFCYEDNSSPFAWVEIGYGEYGQKILRGNNKNRYSDRPYETDYMHKADK